MTIAIFVGIDGVGKTSLIDLIVKNFPSVKAHVVVSDPNVAKAQPGSTVRAAAEQIRQWGYMGSVMNEYHLYDRFPFPDEYVYGPLFGGSAIREQDLSLWDAIMVSHEVKFVYIRPETGPGGDLTPYCTRMSIDPDPYVRTHNGNVAQRILDRYEYLRERSSVPWLLLDYQWFELSQARFVFQWIASSNANALSTKLEATS